MRSGLVGLISLTAAFLLPVVYLVRRYGTRLWRDPDLATAVVLAMFFILFLIDSLFNFFASPVYSASAGALAGFALRAPPEGPPPGPARRPIRLGGAPDQPAARARAEDRERRRNVNPAGPAPVPLASPESGDPAGPPFRYYPARPHVRDAAARRREVLPAGRVGVQPRLLGGRHLPLWGLGPLPALGLPPHPGHHAVPDRQAALAHPAERLHPALGADRPGAVPHPSQQHPHRPERGHRRGLPHLPRGDAGDGPDSRGSRRSGTGSTSTSGPASWAAWSSATPR